MKSSKSSKKNQEKGVALPTEVLQVTPLSGAAGSAEESSPGAEQGADEGNNSRLPMSSSIQRGVNMVRRLAAGLTSSMKKVGEDIKEEVVEIGKEAAVKTKDITADVAEKTQKEPANLLKLDVDVMSLHEVSAKEDLKKFGKLKGNSEAAGSGVQDSQKAGQGSKESSQTKRSGKKKNKKKTEEN